MVASNIFSIIIAVPLSSPPSLSPYINKCGSVHMPQAECQITMWYTGQSRVVGSQVQNLLHAILLVPTI